MNLDRALVLLLASVNAVAGFTPCVGPQSSRVALAPLVRVASPLFSEVEEAAEATTEDAAPAEPAFDTSIYVGNISFGKS